MGGLPWRGRHGEQRGEKKRAATLCLACSPDTLLSSRPNESAPHRSRPCSGCPLDGLRYLLGLVGQCRRYDLLGRRGVTESLARRGWRRSLTALCFAPRPRFFQHPTNPPPIVSLPSSSQPVPRLLPARRPGPHPGPALLPQTRLPGSGGRPLQHRGQWVGHPRRAQPAAGSQRPGLCRPGRPLRLVPGRRPAGLPAGCPGPGGPHL